MSRLSEYYQKEVIPELKQRYSYKNVNLVPKLKNIVVSCVTRDVVQNAKLIESITKDIASITGQKPVVVRAKKSISSFKLREGMPLGCSVTLRGEKMYEFLDRLITLALPRVKDFRGLSPKGFDGKGNYTLGIREQIIFPEINYEKIDKIRGLGVVFVTTAKNNDEGRELLRLMGMPLKK